MKKILFATSIIMLGFNATLFLRADDRPRPPMAINLVFMGDSITQGVGVGDAATQAAPVIATQVLQKQLGNGIVVYFSNQGHAGHTTLDFLPGGGDFSATEAAAKDLATAHPGQLVFSLMLGTNDCATHGTNGAPVSAVDYAHNLEQIIDKLLVEYPDSKFVINHPIWFSPNTNNGTDYEGDSVANRLKSYSFGIDLLVKDFASSHPNQVYVGDTEAYDYFAGHQDELNGEKGLKGIFYLHPNVTGAQSLGGFWAAALAKKIKP